MEISGRGRIVVWQGASLWLLAAQNDTAGTDFHSHHAVQITLSLAGDFALRTQQLSARGPIAAVAADIRHTFEATGAVAFLFIEPESGAGRTLAERLFATSDMVEIDAGPFAPIQAALRTSLGTDCSDHELVGIGQALLEQIAGQLAPPPVNPRVQAMIDYIRANLDGPMTLGAAANRAALSPSRARHLFAQATGLSFKSFVLWQRLERAVEFYAAGHSLTQAAHAAGFSDSAHLSRTFRKTFGIPASMLEVS